MNIDQFVIFAHIGPGLPGHESLMVVASLLPLMLVGTIVVATALQSRGLLGAPDRMVGMTAPLTAIAAGLSLGAAAIHFAVIAEHLAENLAFGLFFLGLGWFQAIWAQVYLLRPKRDVALTGAVVNAGVIGIWIASRTTGLPFGPEPWVAAAVGLPDLVATAFEVGLIGVLLPALGYRPLAAVVHKRMPYQKAVVLAAFCILTVTVLTAVALLLERLEPVTT